MAISLQKGGNVSLTKEDAGLKKLLIGLGWNARTTDGAAFDLDAMAFAVAENGKVRNEKDFIFTTTFHQQMVQLNILVITVLVMAMAMMKH